MRRGALQVELQSGGAHDVSSALLAASLPEGSLRLADWGYFKLDEFAQLSEQGAYWLSRYRLAVRVAHPDGTPFEWGSFLKTHAQPNLDGPILRTGVLIGAQMTTQTVHDLVTEYAHKTGLAPLAPHDQRRTFAKLSRKGGAKLDQIKASLDYASVQTTERYVGDTQSFTDAPAERLKLTIRP